jgi:predicted branched-subunit amino acid permease
LGYFTVAVSLGIAARNAGITAIEGGIMSLTNMTSAGEFAGMTVIAAGSSYLVMAMLQLVINARYLLMSCSLSQRLDERLSIPKRFLLGLTITDEIFGISIRVEGERLDPMYSLGAFCVACPGWTLGTVCGAVMGNILPERVVTALSVALFGMLIAVFVPPTKKDKVVAGAVALSMILSYLFTKLPLFSRISGGVKLILLTVLIAGAAAVLFPVKEEGKDES